MLTKTQQQSFLRKLPLVLSFDSQQTAANTTFYILPLLSSLVWLSFCKIKHYCFELLSYFCLAFIFILLFFLKIPENNPSSAQQLRLKEAIISDLGFFQLSNNSRYYKASFCIVFCLFSKDKEGKQKSKTSVELIYSEFN